MFYILCVVIVFLSVVAAFQDLIPQINDAKKKLTKVYFVQQNDSKIS